jgi:hypothetical protein
VQPKPSVVQGVSRDAGHRLSVPGRQRSVTREGAAYHSVEIELVALDVLHHEARLVVFVGKQ